MRQWKLRLITGLAILLLFMMASEYFDFPHLLLGGRASPPNMAELGLEAIVILVIGVLVWYGISRFEKQIQFSMDQLERLAIMDDLTGLPNRRHCMSRLDNEIQRARRFNRPVSIAIMDLDGFKSINDQLGHLAGDHTLVEFTGLVARHIRSQDFFGRLGGDEFLVIFIETQLSEAASILERVREQWSIAYAPTVVRGGVQVTLSAGVTTPQPNDKSMTDCLRRSDQALYRAKTSGKNKIETG
jgi:diguanylate cyclase (GGDEF)-like protein